MVFNNSSTWAAQCFIIFYDYLSTRQSRKSSKRQVQESINQWRKASGKKKHKNMDMSWTMEEVKLAILLCIFIFPFIFVLRQLFAVEAEAVEIQRLEQEKAEARKKD